MLCDDIIRYGLVGMPTADKSMKPRIAAAHKFSLSKDFSEVADDLTNNFNNIARALPFCRLPYAETWIEVLQHDRPNYRNAQMHAEGLQQKVRRVGWLCSATKPDLSAWKAHLFWECLEKADNGLPSLNCASLAVIINLKEIIDIRTPQELNSAIDQRKFTHLINMQSHPGWDNSSVNSQLEIAKHINVCLPDYPIPIPEDLNQRELETYSTLMIELAQSDWGGEAIFHLAVIGLLNSANTTLRESLDKTKHNIKRAKRGQPPFFSHEILRIHPRVLSRLPSKVDGSRDNTPMREHFVRGHWKVRKSGIFFWHPYLRGNRDIGRVEKTYDVV
jgi:hypothetical protein